MSTDVPDLLVRLRACRCQAEEQVIYSEAARLGLSEPLYRELDRRFEAARAERQALVERAKQIGNKTKGSHANQC